MVDRRPIRKPSVSLQMPAQPTGKTGIASGDRFNPNYSLNNIEVNPNNPRKKQLDKMGLTLKTVKALRHKQDESRDEFEQRIATWITKNGDLTTEQKEAWESFLNVALSIMDNGLLQPIAARQPERPGGMATLIAGERRYLAHWLIGENTIQTNIKSVTDRNASMLTLIENYQRESVSLEGTIHGMRSHEREFGTQHSLSQLARILNISKSSAQGVRWAIDADDDDPVLRALSEGLLTKPYHLVKHFQERKQESSQSDRPNLDSGNAQIDENAQIGTSSNRPNLDGIETGSNKETSFNDGGDRPNLEDHEREGGDTTQVEPNANRPNLDGQSDNANRSADTLQPHDRPNLDDSDTLPDEDAQPEANPNRPNLDDQANEKDAEGNKPQSNNRPNLDDMEATRNLLAAVCLELLTMEAAEYQSIVERIDSATTPTDIYEIVKSMAEKHNEAER